jgi:hypothetical protein
MAETGSDGPWDEARLEEALKRLKLLHIKARMLRTTIPQMIDPLLQEHSSPQIMFQAFMEAVNEAQAEVTKFTKLMKDETSQEILAHAKKSRQENPSGIQPWKHTNDPDWFTLDPETKKSAPPGLY